MQKKRENAMKYYNSLLSAAVCLVLLTAPAGCLEASAAGSAIGYGQGTQVNEENIPLGALDFDAQFRQYGAYATTPDRNRIIITFDQGYENGYTAQILDTLKEKHVTAVFFLTGDYAKKETELVRRMIAEGHMLGNHGMTHASLPLLEDADARKELMSLHEYVMQNYDYTMQYFRCPCGEYSEQALKLAQSCGYRTIFWSGAHVDWLTDKQPDPAQALEKLTAQAHGGEILLLHSVSSTNAQILGELIDRLRDRGYTL